MKIDLIIKALRARCPSFEGRVAGAAQFKNLAENTVVTVPQAFVMPLDDNPEPNRSQNGYSQVVKESFAIIVALDNKPTERGQTSSIIAFDSIRAELWKAVLGWQMGEEYGPIEYEGMATLSMDRARIWYQFEFGMDMQISQEDTYQQTENEELPDFEELSVSVDIIDPAADPNLQSPGPDGRIEHELLIEPPTT